MKFIELLEEYNIEVAPAGAQHSTEGWIQFDCPFCSKDSNWWRMGYNISGGFVNCWLCGGHSLASVLHTLIGYMSWHQINKLIENLDGDIKTVVKKEPSKLELPKDIDKLGNPHRSYLEDREFDWRELESIWQIRGIGISGDLSWRLFIPIIHQGKTVSWDTRAIGKDVKKRYIGAHKDQELISRKHLLYGSDYARDTIIVVEGYPDVWRIGPGAVAIMGITYTPEQVLAISKYSTRYILFDNEDDAQQQADKLCCELAVFPGTTILLELEKAEDPASASIKTILDLRKLLK